MTFSHGTPCPPRKTRGVASWIRTQRSPLALIPILALTACSTSSVVLDTQIAIDAISIAAPVVSAFAGPGAGVIMTYMTAASNGLSCVLSAAEVPGATTLSISAAITSCLASVIAPTLPPGTPQIIVSLVSGVINSILGLITKYGGKKGSSTQKVNLTYQDHKKLKAMRLKLDIATTQLHAH